MVDTSLRPSAEGASNFFSGSMKNSLNEETMRPVEVKDRKLHGDHKRNPWVDCKTVSHLEVLYLAKLPHSGLAGELHSSSFIL